jgi:hypothetical protein
VCEGTSYTSVYGLELHRGRLALIDLFAVGERTVYEVRVDGTGGGPQQLIALLTQGEGGEYWVGASWFGGRLYFYRNGEGPEPFIYRFDPAHNRYAGARGHDDLTGFSMLDGHRAFEATSPDFGSIGGSRCGENGALPCLVRISDPIRFKPHKPPRHVL